MSTKEQQERIELLQGTLDLLILRTLLLGPAHGHAIAKAIEFRSEDVLQVEQGSLYPALHRLIKRGMDFRPGRHVGKQSPGQILPADSQGAATIGGRDQQMGQASGSHCADSHARGAGGQTMSQGKWHRHSCLCPEPDARLGIPGTGRSACATCAGSGAAWEAVGWKVEN